MKFALFGSRIIDDAAARIKDSGHDDVNRIVGISPFSVNGSFLDCNIVTPGELVEKNEYRTRMTCCDINKTAYKELGDSKCNYICMDFGCGTEPLWECCFEDGQCFRITYTDTIKNNISLIRKALETYTGKRIQKEQEINPLLWSNNKIKKEIDGLVNLLHETVNDKRFVLLVPKLAFQYECNGKIVDSKDYRDIAFINEFIDKCSRYFAEKMNCIVIRSSDFILGGEQYPKFNGMNYSLEYYEYINQCLQFITEKNDLYSDDWKTALEVYEKRLQNRVDLLMLPETFQTIGGKINDRKIILIGGSPQYEERLREEYHQEVAFSVPYEKAVTGDELCEELVLAMENKEKYVCFITHFKPEDRLLEQLWQNGEGFIPYHSCYFSFHKSVVLHNFRGNYSDVFHNRVSIKSNGAEVIMNGMGATVELSECNQKFYDIQVCVINQSKVIVGKVIRADKLKINIRDVCSCIVGDNCSFASGCTLICCDFMHIEIGNECMFSNNIIVHAGDGHSVFDMDTGDKINYDKANVPSKFKIKLQDHVWVGYEAFVLAGTNIGTGCVLGGRSLANKAYPNNCVLAGNPARIVKENIAWTRDPFTQNVWEDSGLDDAYMQMTMK